MEPFFSVWAGAQSFQSDSPALLCLIEYSMLIYISSELPSNSIFSSKIFSVIEKLQIEKLLFKVICCAIINNTAGINMGCAVFSGIFFLLLALCLSPFHDSSSFYDHFGLYAIYWPHGVPHLLLFRMKPIMQSNDVNSVTTHSLFRCWISEGPSRGSFQLQQA